MSDNNPTDPGFDGDDLPPPGGEVPTVRHRAAAPEPYYDEYDDYADDPRGRRPGARSPLKKYVGAVLRRRWLLLLAVVVGAAGGALAYDRTQLSYTAQGNLWIQRDGGRGDVTPVSQGGLFESTAWVELLRTFAVLDTVVVAEQLYLSHPDEYAEAFESFDLSDRFAPGEYTLTVAPDGRAFTLATETGAVVQRGALGDSVGNELGLKWRPPAGAFPSDTEIAFEVGTPREAARQLSDQLRTNLDRQGNFISLSLSGRNPEKITSVLNRVMDQHVQLAADLKGSKLTQQLAIIEEQLAEADIALQVAERELEDYRVRTVTLPSDASTPIQPGLEQTRAPVFNRYFGMQVQLEQIRQNRRRLQQIADIIADGTVQVSSLEGIPSVSGSAELQSLLSELIQRRTELRQLRNDFTDEYPPIQDLLRLIETLENESIPQVIDGLLAELAQDEQELTSMVDSASVELESIPTRSIEEARRRRQVAIQEALYNDLRSRAEVARLAEASSIPDIQILDRASVPRVPSTDNRIVNALMVLAGALGAAVGIAILLDRADRRIRHPDEVGGDIGLEILGAIPRVAAPGSKDAQENAGQVMEAFRELRMTVGFAHGVAKPLILTITSPAQSEGKTLITTNLAVAFAETGRRTLLIDGDTRRGDAHKLLGAERSPGLCDYLRDRTSGEIIRSTEYENLDFIPCGTRGASTPELLASSRMVDFLGTLKRAYDVILIDSPPLAAGADLFVLAGLSGQLAIVLRTGSTDKRLAVAKLDSLSRLPVRVLGAILNDVEPKGEYYQYYASYLPDYAPDYEPGEAVDEDDETRLLGRKAGAGVED